MAERRMMSAEGLEELRAELHRLETEERAKVVEVKTPKGVRRLRITAVS